MWLGGRAAGRWTCDQQVAGSNLSHPAIECNPGQVVNAHVPLSPSSIIWYQQWGVMPCGWEGNRRSGVALAMRQTLVVLHLRAQGMEEADEHLPTLSCGAWSTVPFTFTPRYEHSNVPTYKLGIFGWMLFTKPPMTHKGGSGTQTQAG